MKIKDLIPLYLKHLKTLGRSYYTVRGARYGLRDFVRFLDGEGIYLLGGCPTIHAYKKLGILKSRPDSRTSRFFRK